MLRKSDSELACYSDIVRALLEAATDWNDRGTEFALQIAKRCLQQSHAGLVELGLQIIVSSPSIGGKDITDLVYLVVKAAKERVEMTHLCVRCLELLQPHADRQAQEEAENYLAEVRQRKQSSPQDA